MGPGTSVGGQVLNDLLDASRKRPTFGFHGLRCNYDVRLHKKGQCFGIPVGTGSLLPDGTPNGYAGTMLWFTRNVLSGSYVFLISARRR
jgi:hypothetical protein